MKKLYCAFLFLFCTITVKTTDEEKFVQKRMQMQKITLIGCFITSISHFIDNTEDPHSTQQCIKNNLLLFGSIIIVASAGTQLLVGVERFTNKMKTR